MTADRDIGIDRSEHRNAMGVEARDFVFIEAGIHESGSVGQKDVMDA
jgi:hypothetical protein